MPILKCEDNIDKLVVLPNIIDDRLHIVEEHLKEYLTNLYQQDIEGKEDIKHLYDITANQIFSTPYIVNQALPMIESRSFRWPTPSSCWISAAPPPISTTPRTWSSDNIVTENEYDRLVFKRLGVYKSRQSLIFAAQDNEFVYELLTHLKVTENIFQEQSDKATQGSSCSWPSSWCCARCPTSGRPTST